MKRNMDLIRKILLAIEEKGGDPRCYVDLDIQDHSNEEVSYHVQLLEEAGLLEAVSLSTRSRFDVRPKRLTWYGHEFLDAAKNDTVWKKAKEIISEKGGSIPFDVLKALLIKLASSVFGLG